jgi:Heparinase II/III-like protein
MKNNIHFIKLSAFLIICMSISCSHIKTGMEKLPSHPRILLLKGEEAAIANTVSTDLTWQAVHQYILNECDSMIEMQPVERVLIGRRLLDKSREALRRIFYLSYAWRITSEEKYAERAEKEMLAVSAFSDWNPSHFLDVAEMTMALSIGYDWLYRDLSPGSRRIIRDAIIEKGLKPSLDTSYTWWLTSSNNWNQVCNAGMVCGALAIYDTDPVLASSIIERANSSIMLPMHDYLPDGAYPEGYSYWGYGTTFNVMYLAAMEKAFGISYDPVTNEGFFKTARYLENMTGPLRKCFNYSDCGVNGYLQPAMFWFAKKLEDPSLLWSEMDYLLYQQYSDDRLLPAILIWGSWWTPDKMTPVEKNIWVGQGKNPVALMRSSWYKPGAIYVGFKAGSPSVNHGHMDIGSFIMDSQWKRWAMDFGPQDYNSLETAGVDLWNMAQGSQRWDVFRYNNFVHNTITVNRKHQDVDGYASINSWSDQPGMLNAVSDITSLYKESLRKSVRGIAIVDDQYVMVRDEIETLSSDAVIRWNMLTSAGVTIKGNNMAELEMDGERLTLKVISPSRVEMKTWSTAPLHDYDAPNPGTTMVGFEVTVPANSSAILNVLLLPEGASENRAVSLKSLAEWPKGSNED